MTKEKVTKEEFEALGLFMEDDVSFEQAVKYYLHYSKCWTDRFKPLKDMGMFRFVSAITNGYELEKTIYKIGSITVSEEKHIIRLGKEGNSLYCFNISETKHLIKALTELLDSIK